MSVQGGKRGLVNVKLDYHPLRAAFVARSKRRVTNTVVEVFVGWLLILHGLIVLLLCQQLSYMALLQCHDGADRRQGRAH